MFNALRPYQRQIAAAVLDSVRNRKGLTFSVEISRQGGKNELSAHIERYLLARYLDRPLQLVKCSPTFKPQTIISMMRLKDCFNDVGLGAALHSEMGYILRCGQARAVFLSANTSSSVVGNTAHLLLEVDESQDIDSDKFNKDFKPMSAANNCTVVHYGTTWDDSTLLESIKQTNLELEKKDGIRRHFRFDYREVGRYNPQYLANVEMERQRLGEDHPLFRTQYLLLPLHGGGGFLDAELRGQLQGDHPRQDHGLSSKVYVAGIDLAGEHETGPEEQMTNLSPEHDSTVITIAELTFEESSLALPPKTAWSGPTRPVTTLPPAGSRPKNASPAAASRLPPHLRIVEHYSWSGRSHAELYPQMVDILHNVWHCKRIVVDATGMGEPVTSQLRQTLGEIKVIPFSFTSHSKSRLGYDLLAAVGSGRLKMYAADNSAEYREFWHQMEHSRGVYHRNQALDFFVNPSEGHDDYLVSLALLVEAGRLYKPSVATMRMPDPYAIA